MVVVVGAVLVLEARGAAARVDRVVVGALAYENKVGKAEVAGEGYCGGREACEAGACGALVCGWWWGAWLQSRTHAH